MVNARHEHCQTRCRARTPGSERIQEGRRLDKGWTCCSLNERSHVSQGIEVSDGLGLEGDGDIYIGLVSDIKYRLWTLLEVFARQNKVVPEIGGLGV